MKGFVRVLAGKRLSLFDMLFIGAASAAFQRGEWLALAAWAVVGACVSVTLERWAEE